ncbi:hypothetical protein E1166_00490 [Micromonospora sp. KC213]|nr:hypothetical protein E1166_00490 [Micromonospora sp. KC213]
MTMRRTIMAAVLLLALWPTAPAAAHGGPVVLDVAGDGATGVTVRATYKDGHPVEDRVLRLVLHATGDGGRKIGPLQLNPANEGQGFYASGAVLTPGRWTVAVTSPEPNPGKAQATVQARAPQSAPPRQATAPRPDEAGGGGTGRWWLVGGALLLGAVAALALTARRGKATAGRRG